MLQSMESQRARQYLTTEQQATTGMNDKIQGQNGYYSFYYHSFIRLKIKYMNIGFVCLFVFVLFSTLFLINFYWSIIDLQCC